MRNFPIFLLIGLLCLNTCQALYDSSSPVVKLTKDNFKKKVLDSDQLWFVEFFAPWCGHCKSLAPSWEKAAKQLKGVVNVGAVDMTTDEDVGKPYGISGFPTIKFFGFDKGKPQDYQGQRDADSIINYGLDKVSSEVKKRMKDKSGGSSKSSDSSSKKEDKKSSTTYNDKDVVVLDDNNFDEKVLQSKDIWLVEFYAPWCGHCKKLEPEWNEAATKLKGSVKLGKVDATAQEKLAQRFQIKGYPTIKVFDYGTGKSDSRARDYDGIRDAGAIVNFALDLVEKADIEPEIHELISQKVYDNNCQGQTICILTFLPNIYDSNAHERNGYLEIIGKAAKKQRKSPFQFFWLQAGDQLDLERSLNLGFGFPAVVALAPHKGKMGVMKAAFDEKQFQDFLNNLLTGGVGLEDLRAKIEFKKVDKWDGKDAPPLEDDSSISEDL